MTTSDSSMRSWKRALGAFGLLAVLALAPAPAQAEVCGDFGDIADDLLDAYYDSLGSFFPLYDEKTCNTMTSTFLKACQTAVKDAVKCADRQIDTIPKAAKPACNLATKNPSACYNDYKDDAGDASDFVSDQAESANDDCVVAANEFVEVCRFGF